MADSWLDDLEALYEADKMKQQEASGPDPAAARQPGAADILRNLNALKLLQRVQSILLRGGGSIDEYDHHSSFERLVTLVWQGPISAARPPSAEDPSDFHFISIGVKGQQVYVNDKPLANPTPQTLRRALVAAAKQPGRRQNKS